MMSIILMSKKNVVKKRAGCFQKVDNVRTLSLWIRLKEAIGSSFVRRFHQVHSCSAKNLLRNPWVVGVQEHRAYWLRSVPGVVSPSLFC